LFRIGHCIILEQKRETCDMASVYLLGKKYYVQFYYNNKKYQKSLKTSYKARALRLQAIIEQKINSGEFPDISQLIYIDDYIPGSQNIIDFINQVESETVSNHSLSISYRKRVAIYFKNFRSYLEENNIKKFNQISNHNMIEFSNFRQGRAGQKRNSTIKPKTLRDELIFIKTKIFERAIDENLINNNPCKLALKQIRIYAPNKEPFTESEIKKLIKHSPQNLKLFIQLLYFTGCRTGEIKSLMWPDIDFEKRLIYIRNTQEHQTKNRRNRVVPLHPKLYELLEPIKKDSGYVFPSPSGTNDSSHVKNFRKNFCKIRDQLGISNEKSLHAIRHSTASHMQSRGVDISIIKSLLGHKSIRMTEKYQTTDIKTLQRNIKKL